MSNPKTRYARVTEAKDGKGEKAATKRRSAGKHRHIVSQDMTWMWFKLFSLENGLNMSECFETLSMVLHKYKSDPKSIGPKLMAAIEKRVGLEKDEHLTMDDI